MHVNAASSEVKIEPTEARAKSTEPEFDLKQEKKYPDADETNDPELDALDNKSVDTSISSSVHLIVDETSMLAEVSSNQNAAGTINPNANINNNTNSSQCQHLTLDNVESVSLQSSSKPTTIIESVIDMKDKTPEPVESSKNVDDSNSVSNPSIINLADDSHSLKMEASSTINAQLIQSDKTFPTPTTTSQLNEDSITNQPLTKSNPQTEEDVDTKSPSIGWTVNNDDSNV